MPADTTGLDVPGRDAMLRVGLWELQEPKNPV